MESAVKYDNLEGNKFVFLINDMWKDKLIPFLWCVWLIGADKMLWTLLAEKGWGNIMWCLTGRGLKVFKCLFARRNGGAESWLQVDPINPGITHVNKQQFWKFLNIYSISQLHFSILPWIRVLGFYLLDSVRSYGEGLSLYPGATSSSTTIFPSIFQVHIVWNKIKKLKHEFKFSS